MSSSSTSSSSFEVQLAVYDLSHGMARQMSAQFLGGPQYAIDIIPHTAVVVYGREYFFGGGIQHEDPNQFRSMMGMYPVQILSLGHTSVSQQQFESWCQSCTTSGRYTMASYDLLNRNCNNFSHDAAIEGLQLSQGVPQWILDVPRKFLSSPMGQMVRPMLENMQMGAARPGMAAPFANAPTNSFSAANSNYSSNPAPPPPPAAAMANPWANISKPATSESATKSTTKEEETTTTNNNNKPGAAATPVLDSFCKPLTSEEYKTIALCIKKICTTILQDSTSDQEVLQKIGQKLSDPPHELNNQDVEDACHLLHSKVLNNNNNSDKSVITFTLMLLRVIILQSTGQEKSVLGCLEWIQSQLSKKKAEESTPPLLSSTTNHAGRSMAWLTLANAASLSWWNSSSSSSSFIEMAFVDWTIDSQPRKEVRQAAAAYCYNKVLLLANDSNNNKSDSNNDDALLSDESVSLLCSSLEGIIDEPDPTTRLRRLLVAVRILVPSKSVVLSSVKSLMQDLGFPDAIQELQKQQQAATTSKDAQQCQALAAEMAGLLQG